MVTIERAWLTSEERDEWDAVRETLEIARVVTAQRQGAADDVEPWQAEFYQREPAGNWTIWMLRTGRGAGKTEAAARSCLEYLRHYGKEARLGIGAPIVSDVRDTCLEGDSGLITIAPDEFRYNRSLLEAWHKDGGYVKAMGSETPARWNGGNWGRLWWDEGSLCRHESFQQSMFALRKDPAQLIMTLTPKRTQWTHELEMRPNVRRALTEDGRIPTMYDNPHLSQSAVAWLEQEYGGTDLGRAEIYGEWLDEVSGALWKRAWINDHRIAAEDLPGLSRVVVAIDPSGSGSQAADECGILVVGLGNDKRGYVLADRSLRASPHEWAAAAVEAYREFQADRIVAERNYGGEMVEATLRSIDDSVPYKGVVATRGKTVRAEPIAARYQKGEVSHVGMFAKLEDEQCSWVQGDKSPNRLDAVVWGLVELLEGGSPNIRFLSDVPVRRTEEAQWTRI